MVLELGVCPQCGETAEIIDAGTLESTMGPIQHSRVRCITKEHLFLMPSEGLVRL